jgi:osmoprotectant transport system permease protein
VTLLATVAAAAGSRLPGDVAREPVCYSRTVNDWICGDYLRDRREQLVDATVQHLWITAAAVALGLVMAFPLALVARRHRRLESAIVGSATSLYTIPSLALFPLLVPWTGISATTVVIGLAVYCLTILVRALLDGLRSVPGDVVESATGLGYGPVGLLWRVQLPLSLPVVMAGLRVATVSTVALTTVGTLVSHGGLGNLISDGVFSNFRAELLAACVLCVLLAVALDVLLVGVQRVLTPWTRGRSA